MTNTDLIDTLRRLQTDQPDRQFVSYLNMAIRRLEMLDRKNSGQSKSGR